MTNDRPRISVDEAALRGAYDAANLAFPSVEDDKPAGDLMQMFDNLVDADIVKVPDGYRVSIINDDELDITGMVISVEVVGAGWPYISDGWSDIDNYLPTFERVKEDDYDEFAAIREAVHAVIGRADRCMAFAHNARQAMTLGEPPAELADAWARYQRGDKVEGYELSKLDEWRADRAQEAGF